MAQATTDLTVDEPSLDGGRDVLLAPVRGVDRRQDLPRELFERSPARFTLKFTVALVLIAAGCLAVAVSPSWPITALAMLVLGLMYAHLVELQHECLHEHAYRSRMLNRVCGFVCGLFMLSSYSHYKYQHLRHHALLGKPQNKEFFNYRFRNLDSLSGFARATFDLSRYKDVLRDIARSCLNGHIPGVTKERELKRIRAEYRLFFILLLAAAAFTAWSRNPFLIVAWLVPVLVVAEAAHFLIELPEHFGLNTQTDSNVLSNTRTIEASRFAQWFTNYNNLHTAHHYHQGVPMANVENLNQMVRDQFVAVEPSYWSFYRKVVRGEIGYHDTAETCMTR
jgi:fatty acid desaturase